MRKQAWPGAKQKFLQFSSYVEYDLAMHQQMVS